MRDLEAFAGNLRAGVDTRGLREGVRFAADLARGVAQVGYEFGRAAVYSGNIFGEMAEQVPQLRDTFRSLQAVVQGMKDVRVDPETISALAISAGKEALLLAAAAVETGMAFKANVLDPIADLLKDLRDTKDYLKGGAGAGALGRQAGELWRKVDPEARAADRLNIPPPAAQTDAGRFAESIAKTAKHLDALGKAIEERITAEKQAKKLEQEAESNAARRRELEASIAFIRAYRSGEVGSLQGLVPGQPLTGLAGGYRGLQREAGFRGALAGGPEWLNRMASHAPQRLDFGTEDPHINEVAKRIKEDFDPLVKLNRTLKDFDLALRAGKVTAQEFAFARDKEIRSVADAAGIGGPARLPEAALQNSAEAIRVVNQWQAGGGRQTAEDLLRQLVDLTRERNQKAGFFERQAGKLAIVEMPK